MKHTNLTKARASHKSAPAQSNAPVKSDATAQKVGGETEWVRLPKAGQLLLGMTRTYFYHLGQAGLIETKAIRMPGKKRGIRLVNLQSVRAFLAADEGAEASNQVAA